MHHQKTHSKKQRAANNIKHNAPQVNSRPRLIQEGRHVARTSLGSAEHAMWAGDGYLPLFP